jgi:hypothetical protein
MPNPRYTFYARDDRLSFTQPRPQPDLKIEAQGQPSPLFLKARTA